MATKKKKKLTKEEVNAIVYQDIGEVMPAPATQAEVEAVATGTVKTGSGIINLTRLSQFRQKLTLAASAITGKLDLTSQVKNSLPVANGGTNISSLGSSNVGKVLQVNSSGTGYDLVDPYVAQMKKAPVGTIYMSYSSTSPSGLYGGSWVQITDRVLRAANNIDPGGSDTAPLTVDNMPSHNHKETEGLLNIGTSSSNISVASAGNLAADDTSGAWIRANKASSGVVLSTCLHSIRFIRNGNSVEHNNLPAYQNFYVWHKIALT